MINGWRLLAIMVLLSTAATAHAQEGPSLRAHHFTVEAAATWSGEYAVGSASANLRGNGAGVTPPIFTLFTTDSRVSSAVAPELRVGFALTRGLAIEGGLMVSTPHIGVAIRADAEAPSQELLGERIQQYVFSGGVNWQLPIGLGSRLAPFATVGAAFLRQLHEDRTLAEAGEIYYAGAGARYWLRGADGATRAVGLRGDARINLRRKGIDFEDKMRSYPTFSLALFVGL